MARRILSKPRLAGLLLLAGVASAAISASHGYANAQATDSMAASLSQGDDSGQMLLSANELVYNHDTKKVFALGGVQIFYNGYRMVANKVEYDQNAGRLMAYDGIEVIDPDGNRMRAEKLDVTDDFANGFVNAISVRTPDNLAIAGERAQRVDGNKMIVENGVYTACIPCSENPAKPPLWQIRAERVIQNGETHTIRLEHPRFQLLGQTIALLPSIEVPDQTVKRKAGFLFPSMSMAENLGFGLSVPYYLPINPSSDVTFTGTGYTQQGFLLDVEYRKRYRNGEHILRLAGIDQMNPDNFRAKTSDAEAKSRGMIASTGQFRINPRWVFGWDVMAQTDSNFSRTYSIAGHAGDTFNNQIYLEGLGKRNSFSAKANYFDIQDADTQNASEKKQAIVAPVIDYDYFAPEPVKGGQLSITSNLTNIIRRQNDVVVSSNGKDRFLGLEGSSTRLTSEISWKRTFTTSSGFQLTPILSARADGYLLDVDSPDQIVQPDNKTYYHYGGNFIDQSAAARGMVTAGLEARYPWIATNSFSSHIFEPIAQVFVRPDEPYAGGLPNEDAQSFVFDTSNLFDQDKFSGFDRIEGGTRANLGFRYTGDFDSGVQLEGVFGQSYQLAGENSFAQPDLVGVGIDSGLQSSRSDYVGSAAVRLPDYGLSLSGGARFDEADLSLNRTNASIDFTSLHFDTGLDYTNVAAQPGYAYDEDNRELKSTSTIKFDENWSVSGSATWDLSNDEITRSWVGVTYEDICTAFSLIYKQRFDDGGQSAVNWSIGGRLTFRTLGDIAVGTLDGDTFN